MTISLKEKEIRRAKDRVRKQLYRQKKKASMSAEERGHLDWNYRCVNWVYVVLSRVRTLAGLYLMKPLDLERSFNVPDSLIRFEQRLKDNKERPILDMLGYHNN